MARRTPETGTRARTAVPRAVLGAAVAVSLVILFAPGDDVPAAAVGVDKAVHLALFAVLALTGRWAGVRVWPLGGALLAYAAGSEVVQAFPPLQRSGSLTDLAADAGGVLLGLLFWPALRGRDAHRG